jgi:hypothetical protein
VPLLIDATVWQELKAGLVQRAELLEAILADIYGPANLVREGRQPACRRRRQSRISPAAGRHQAVRRRASAVLRRRCGPLAGPGAGGCSATAPRRRRARATRWENRLALSRAMPDIYRQLRVERVAPFFQALQADLSR